MEKEPVKVDLLPGGVTNHNYVLSTESGKFVIRIAGEGTENYINRSAELQNAKLIFITVNILLVRVSLHI